MSAKEVIQKEFAGREMVGSCIPVNCAGGKVLGARQYHGRDLVSSFSTGFYFCARLANILHVCRRIVCIHGPLFFCFSPSHVGVSIRECERALWSDGKR